MLYEENNTYCKGCSLYDTEFYPVCYIYEIEGISKMCPCSICLVKATCSVMCKDRKKFYLEASNNFGPISAARSRYDKTRSRIK